MTLTFGDLAWVGRDRMPPHQVLASSSLMSVCLDEAVPSSFRTWATPMESYRVWTVFLGKPNETIPMSFDEPDESQ